MDLLGITETLSRAPAFARLRDAVDAGRASITSGVSDAAKPAAIAALALGREAPVLVLTSKEDRADRLAEEIAAWLGEAIPVYTFPERDVLPYERIAPDPQTVRERLEILSLLSAGRPAIIVACGLAVAQRTLSPSEARDAIQFLRPGQRLDVEGFLRGLAALGYTMEPVVQEAGQAGRRGGIIDVFPPTSEFPVRIELIGHEIESLRLFDPNTQRSVRAVDGLTIGPSLEMLAGRIDLKALARLDLKACKPEARGRFEEEIALLRDGNVPEGIDYYVPFLARSTLLDHLPEGALVIVDEEADTAEALQ
jgi:transcription-repair coupling factor (superfamily II helicase)